MSRDSRILASLLKEKTSGFTSSDVIIDRNTKLNMVDRTEQLHRALEKFICHVDQLSAEEDPSGNGFHREYRVGKCSNVDICKQTKVYNCRLILININQFNVFGKNRSTALAYSLYLPGLFDCHFQ